MRFGEVACDGRIEPRNCAMCWMQKHGIPAAGGRILAAIPPHVSRSLGLSIPEKHVASALYARAFAERHQQDFGQMVANADRIVAIAGWLLEALRLNGVPTEKLLLCRSGVDATFADAIANARSTTERRSCERLRVVYLGRCDPRKGLHVLVRAVRSLVARAEVELVIYGLGGIDDGQYAAEIRRLAEGDKHIVVQPPVPRAQLVDVFSQADVVAIPSLALETGPLVALEAKTAGVYIVGSRLGGIAELVREPEDGLLLPPGDVDAWAQAIARLASNRPVKRRSRADDQTRTMREVATEMAEVYETLCAGGTC
jgi:glycosyltransferase involved in cell wall biosynthesis